jgi:hypothetical protein
MSVCCELSGRGFCDELIPCPEESYRLWCVVVCDLRVETSWMRRPCPTGGSCAKRTRIIREMVAALSLHSTQIFFFLKEKNLWSMWRKKSVFLYIVYLKCFSALQQRLPHIDINEFVDTYIPKWEVLQFHWKITSKNK